MVAMAVAAEKLDVRIGDLVESGCRRYDVVSDKARGVALETAITKMAAELRAERGGKPLTDEEFDELFDGQPFVGEG
jgi:hypothetical protein